MFSYSCLVLSPKAAAGTDILKREDRSILVRGGSTGLVTGGNPEKEVDPDAIAAGVLRVWTDLPLSVFGACTESPKVRGADSEESLLLL